ncbi:MAG: hypothetical protein MUF52_06930 [Syntrophobacteraceae bacterium]|jgi:hypothetical protein|nr:hypothetical protein [Syntrophobacteraceae bacterium]
MKLHRIPIEPVASAGLRAPGPSWHAAPSADAKLHGDAGSNVTRVPFDLHEIQALEHAIEIAEDLVSNHYKISTSDWKRYRYDIRSLSDLTPEEITDSAFAQIRRYLRCPDQKLRGGNPGDYFKICLQDHVIRKAARRDPQIGLQALAVYIISHELIHVIRFARFIQRFDATPGEQELEEARVHDLTFQVLANCRGTGIQEVLGAFRDCRTMETFHGVPEGASPQQGR